MAPNPKNSRHPTHEIIERLRSTLDELDTAAGSQLPPITQRRQIDESIRVLTARLNKLLRDLDPIKQPDAVFDPAKPALMGRFVALGLIAQPRKQMAQIESFYGSGVYAIYYNGNFPEYRPIRKTETPIYVGKVDPATEAAREPIEQGDRLSRRVREHSRNIQRASSLNINDFEYRGLVVQSGWQDAAENCLIRLFKPVWNSETGICYGLGKHGDDPQTRANMRSPWDTLHPGREWAARTLRDAKTPQRIKAELKEHFGKTKIFKTMDEVLRSFIDELRQIPAQ